MSSTRVFQLKVQSVMCTGTWQTSNASTARSTDTSHSNARKRTSRRAPSAESTTESKTVSVRKLTLAVPIACASIYGPSAQTVTAITRLSITRAQQRKSTALTCETASHPPSLILTLTTGLRVVVPDSDDCKPSTSCGSSTGGIAQLPENVASHTLSIQQR